jgi:hypothetical protein
MITNIAITGYYGTGSSAVLDLLKEYSDCNIAAPVSTEYEHIALFTPGGLFDLYSILSSPFLSVYNSDMAINNFIEAAKRQNNYDYGWFGSYKKYYGAEFMDMTMQLVNTISRKTGRQSTAHTYKTRTSLIKAFLQIAAKIIIKRPITKLGRVYVNDKYPGYYSMPTKDALEMACKKYTSSYIGMCAAPGKINLFDHLLWPQQCCVIDDLFDNNLKVIVAQRDPRDVYLLNKYYWFKPPVTISKPYYPTDVETFCKEWKESIRTFKNVNILNLFFEDLIYNYDNTVKVIEDFVGISAEKHLKKKQNFKPDMSIENTQIFMVNDEWHREIRFIEDELADYLYKFPYQRKPDKSQWFDGEAQLARIKKKK